MQGSLVKIQVVSGYRMSIVIITMVASALLVCWRPTPGFCLGPGECECDEFRQTVNELSLIASCM